MKGLTVRPVGAWAMEHAGLRSAGLANRTTYRGRVVLYAGTSKAIGLETLNATQHIGGRSLGALVDDAELDGCRAVAWRRPDGSEEDHTLMGHVFGTATIEDCHPAADECGCRWTVSETAWHVRLADMAFLVEPIPVGKGTIGLWKPSRELMRRIS